MKLFVYSMCVLFSVANAGHLAGGGHGSSAPVIKVKVISKNHDHGYGQGHGPIGAPEVIKVVHENVRNSGYTRSNGVHGHAAARQVLHQGSAPVGGYNNIDSNGYHASHGSAAVPQIIKVIHHNNGFSGGHGGVAHVTAPKVVNVIHEHTASSVSSVGYNFASPAREAPPVINVVHQQTASSGSFASAAAPNSVSATPAKAIRVIHEQGQSQVQSQSFAGVPSAVAPETNYLPPFKAPAPAFNPSAHAPSAQYIPPASAPAPAPQYIAPAPATQYTVPTPQYNTPAYVPTYSSASAAQYSASTPKCNTPAYYPTYSAPATQRDSPSYSSPVSSYNGPTFTAPEPVPAPAHVPAQTYGPPSY